LGAAAASVPGVVEGKPLDEVCDRVGNEPADRLAALEPLTHLARGGRDGRDLEELDALRPLEPRQHSLEALAREAGPRRDAEPREAEDHLRLLPRQEIAELVGADEEERIGPVPVAQRVDRARVVVESDFVVRERCASELEARGGVELDALVPRIGDDEDDEPDEGEPPLGLARERDVAVVRRIERPAEEPGQRNSRTSSPISTSSPRRTPAARSASSSSAPAGGRPTTR
jgi:hypothetical protein